jgi:hypothetical protein
MTHRHGRNIHAHPGARIFKATVDDSSSVLERLAGETNKQNLMRLLSCN